MRYTYQTENTCSKEISFTLTDGKVHDLSFVGGCNGNLKAISKLLEGKDANDVIMLLEGTLCGRRPTSCSDQLTIALKKAMNGEL